MAKRHTRGWGAGTISEVRPGVWRAQRSRDAQGRRASRTFAGADAEQRAAQWARGDPEPATLYLGAWLERWLALRRPTLARNTYDLYRRHVEVCLPLATRPLAAVTVDEWQALTNSLLDRWSRYHVFVWRGNIGAALRAAIPEHLTVNPLERVRLPRAEEQIPKAWTQAEVDRLLSAAAGLTHEPWLLFVLGAGVRLGESRALLWSDVDLAAMVATIRASLDNSRSTRGPTKTRRVRVIDIPAEVVPVLAELRKRQPAGQQLVFGYTPKRGTERAYRPRSYRSWLATRCREAGVPCYPVHALRHTYASLGLDAGVPAQDLARQLGHSVSVLLETYAHWIGKGQRRAANAVGAALRRRFSGPERLDGAQNGTR